MALITASCTSYQYVLVGSELPKDKSSHSVFYQEEEDLVIYYDFFGEGMPLDLTIHNDSAQELYVDLHKSAFLQNGLRAEQGLQPALLYTGSGTIQKDDTQASMMRNLLKLAPGDYAVLKTYPFDTEDIYPNPYFQQALVSHDVDHSTLLFNSLLNQGNIYEVQIRLARESDLSDAWVSSASFKDIGIYNTNRSPRYLVHPSGDLYYQKYTSGGRFLTNVLLTTVLLMLLTS